MKKIDKISLKIGIFFKFQCSIASFINSFLFLGGYYTIELAGSRIRLVALNMNLYMEDIMDEMKFRRTDLRGRGVLLKGGRPGDPSLGAVTDPDPMGQWAWLSKVMETAKKKQQNVSYDFCMVFFFRSDFSIMNVCNRIHTTTLISSNMLHKVPKRYHTSEIRGSSLMKCFKI